MAKIMNEVPQKKKKFSDHIMPHRIVNHTLWLAAEGAVLFVLRKILMPFWGTAAHATGAFTAVYIIMGIIAGAFCALCEAVRLHRDQTLHKEFLDAAGKTFDAKAETRFLFRSDELWNDTAIFSVLSCIVLIVTQIATWLSLMTSDQYETLADVQSVFVPLAVTYFFVWVFACAGYCISHLFFSVFVHKKWAESRIRYDEEIQKPERKPSI